MGRPIIRNRFDGADYARFSSRLRESLQALERVLARPGFGEHPPSLGAELELSIVGAGGRPLPISRALLAQSTDPRLTLVLDRFNLEVNLTPLPAAGRPFSAIQAELEGAVAGLGAAASVHGGRVVLVGILPTLEPEDLEPSALTDLPRYRALSSSLRALRAEPQVIRIDGDEPLAVTCSDVTLEGANTSFRVHLRVPPASFAATYNAAQLATPLALAVGANSPIFLRHRLWAETRIAFFRKAVDHRDVEAGRWHPPARVSFGHGWVRRGALELFAEAVSLYPPLLPALSEEAPLDALARGGLPALEELRLHQGTVWRWNRAIYDPREGGQLRIEFRALPAGPTPLDMLASAAFLVGLTVGLRRHADALAAAFPFAYAEYNFYRAARAGLGAELLWPRLDGPSPRVSSAGVLAAELLPVAEEGLAMLDVEGDEAKRCLDVIRGRLASGITGAVWQRRELARRDVGHDRAEALALMLETYLSQAARGRPVHDWAGGR